MYYIYVLLISIIEPRHRPRNRDESIPTFSHHPPSVQRRKCIPNNFNDGLIVIDTKLLVNYTEYRS